MKKTLMVLVVEDDPSFRYMLMEYLGGEYDVVSVATGKQFYRLATGFPEDFDALVVDIHLPDWDGDEAVKLIQDLNVDTPVIFITGDLSIAENLPSGSKMLVKPFSGKDLLNEVRNSLR